MEEVGVVFGGRRLSYYFLARASIGYICLSTGLGALSVLFEAKFVVLFQGRRRLK